MKRDFSNGYRDDRYLSPKDGRPKKLVVQSTVAQVGSRMAGVTWDGVNVKNKGPWIVRLSSWALNGSTVLTFVPASMVLAVVVRESGC